MRIKTFDEIELLACAKKEFPDTYVEIVSVDIFLKVIQPGQYQAPWLEHTFFVSTQYAYEDVEVNGNHTRCKIAMQCILVKPDRYTILYDTKDVFYAVVEEQEEIQFKKYREFIEDLPKTVTAC